MSSNKHIVWITPGFAASEADDTCIPTLLDLLQYIHQNENITISVVALQYPYTYPKYQILGANVYPMNGRNKWYNKISVWKKTLQTLETIHQQQPIDLVHSFWLGDAALMAQAFAKQKKIKHICTIMGKDALKENRHIKNKRLKDIPIIALSAFQADTFYKNSEKRAECIIPFGTPAYGTDYPKKQYDIIGVGSLIPLKNYEMWIEIIALIKQSIPGIKAVLVGEGEQRKELENFIEKKKLSNSIKLMGHKTRKETLELINESKLFLHTSKYEGQGYVFMEAMSMKLPILTTPVGYSIENEKIWKGISPEVFADEIVHLLHKTDLKVNYQFPDIKETYNKYKTYYQ